MLQTLSLLEAYLPYQVQEAFLQQSRRPVRIIGLSTSLVLLSTLVTWLLFVLCEVVSPRVSSGYRSLQRKDQVGWSTRIASTIHAVVVTLLSLYTLWTEPVLYQQPLLARTGLGEVAMCITIGYLLGDFVLIVLHFDTLDTPSLNRQTLLHHVCGIVGFTVCLQYGACQYFGLFRLLSEASTPFLNARWFLDKLHLKQSRLYMFNGVLLAAVFFQSRIFVMPLYWHRMWVFRDQILRIPPVVQVTSFVIPIVLDMLNLYWFRLLAYGCYKALHAASPIEHRHEDELTTTHGDEQDKKKQYNPNNTTTSTTSAAASTSAPGTSSPGLSQQQARYRVFVE